MTSTNIVLVGFMGSGKTKVSKALEVKLGRERFSTDEIIERCEGMSVSWIFRQNGEDYFRHVEAHVVKDLSDQQGIIIDCGGGVITNPENILQLKQHGKIFFLNSSPQAIYNRLKHDTTRPLLQVPDPLKAIEELMHKRLPLYQQAADITISSEDGAIDRIVVEIIKEL